MAIRENLSPLNWDCLKSNFYKNVIPTARPDLSGEVRIRIIIKALNSHFHGNDTQI